MKTRDIAEMLILAALWGASFMFMRLAAPEFGPVVLIELRVALAALCLIPVLWWRRGQIHLKGNWPALAIVGITNSALPFCLLAFATLYVTGGFASILNATTPLWGAAIAWIWLGDRLSGSRVVGLLVGFCGVLLLVWNKLHFSAGGAALAVPAALLATSMYGFAANYTKQRLTGVNSLAVATGSLICAALLLLPAAIALWPQHPVSARAWMAVIIMAIASTGLAYILYFRLLARIGPAKVMTVTFLIPLFGVLWGALFLNEQPTLNMLAGSLVILLGTALAAGLVSLPGKLATARSG
ncbi:DMT family transporter [Parachitinimonas caeni]|uniref:DMT family transporter n=1 Tax=Parachitinimonas caeni TaxID=3031301 RepID=A0ABT7DXE9_9NEIS|nr:DMT family transporter [Parachitinimonas caeni]MDK2124742.1 DMT family transporter [Parachitinimonas caeni]